MSPLWTILESAPFAALSNAAAGADKVRDSNTPTTTQADFDEPGVLSFVLNSTMKYSYKSCDSCDFSLRGKPMIAR